MSKLTQKMMSIFTVLVMLATSACTTDQRIVTLEGVIDSLEILLPVLEVANPQNAAIYAMIDVAIAGLPTALQKTEAELATTDTDATKAVLIAEFFAPSVANIQGLPPLAQAIVVGVLNAIKVFLNAIAPVPTGVTGVGKYNIYVAKKYSLPKDYQTKISDISARIGHLPTTR